MKNLKNTKPKSVKEAILHNKRITELEKHDEALGIKDDVLPEVEEGKVRDKKKWERLGFWNKRKLKKKPETAFLIRMFFSNGTSKEFIICTKDEIFSYKKRWYYLRYQDSWFNLTQSQYELCYFDDYPVPLDRSITQQGDKRFWGVTPENIKPLVEMNYVKVLAQSQELEKKLSTIQLLCILMLFILLGTLYYVFKLGKQIQLITGAGG